MAIKESMANTGAEAPPKTEEGRAGPLDAVLNALGFRRKAKAEAAAAAAHAEERPGSDLIDQAEAFQTVTVADVMIPRADIVALEISSTFDEVIAQLIETEHSRIPIYRDTLDDPVGFVHIKDVFKLMAGKMKRPAASEEILGRLRRESLYVPPSMRAADLLVRMQASRIHLAMVIDEFGGVDGLVTLEDVIEAVVG
jgi:CBS domain containing-hemolysin-like protein